MTRFVCAACGTQYGDMPAPPAICAICEDDRQYVAPGGQRWTTGAELARGHAFRIEDDDGVPGIGTAPGFAINQRAAIVSGASARVMWESLSFVSAEAVAAITADGPVDAIAISHPHFYAAMRDWSEALDAPIYLHAADRAWVQDPDARVVYWSGDRHEIAPGLTLVHCGGHFPGSAALHWRDRACPDGALFSGDALQVSANRRHVSFMYSYPNAVPMHPDAVRAMRRRLAGFDFARVFGYTWGRNIAKDGRRAVDASFDAYLNAIGAAIEA